MINLTSCEYAACSFSYVICVTRPPSGYLMHSILFARSLYLCEEIL